MKKLQIILINSMDIGGVMPDLSGTAIKECSLGNLKVCIPYANKQDYLDAQPQSCVKDLNSVAICQNAAIFRPTPTSPTTVPTATSSVPNPSQAGSPVGDASTSSGISTGAIAGIIVAVLVIVGAAVGFVVYRKRRQRNEELQKTVFASNPPFNSASSPPQVIPGHFSPTPAPISVPAPQFAPVAPVATVASTESQFAPVSSVVSMPSPSPSQTGALFPPLGSSEYGANSAPFLVAPPRTISHKPSDFTPSSPTKAPLPAEISRSNLEPVESWTVAAVSEWLTNNGISREIVKLFQIHSINGRALLTLTEGHLERTMGMSVLGERLEVLALIERLKAKASPTGSGDQKTPALVNLSRDQTLSVPPPYKQE
ncbi:hypothetical protein HDU97_003901 [Phlyctochytrium planicorne]|nr:hypothetical protein HDU97_003901 [Phlyctochytrium planicorne]